MIENEDEKTLIASPGLAQRSAGAPKARLTCSDPAALNGGDDAEILLQGAEVTIGRGDENDFLLKIAGVSRKHARAFLYDDDWYIEDLGSTNGIKVNGETVHKAMLCEGDRVEIGPVPYSCSIELKPEEKVDKTTLRFPTGIPGFDSKRRSGVSDSSADSNALIWSLLVIGASALVFAVFTIVPV